MPSGQCCLDQEQQESGTGFVWKFVKHNSRTCIFRNSYSHTAPVCREEMVGVENNRLFVLSPPHSRCNDVLHTLVQIILLHSLDHFVHQRVHRTWVCLAFPCSPLQVERQVVLPVQLTVVPLGGHPHVGVVRLSPGRVQHRWQWLEQKARQVGRQRCPVEVVEQVPIDDRVQGWTFWRGETHITFLCKNRLELPTKHERGNVGNCEGGMVDGWMWCHQWIRHLPYSLLGRCRSALWSGHRRVSSVISDTTCKAGDCSPFAEDTFGVQVGILCSPPSHDLFVIED